MPADPPPAVDPFEAARRDERLVVPEPMPRSVDAWDELQLLAAKPVQAAVGQVVASRVAEAGAAERAPRAEIPALPTWDGDTVAALSQRLAARRLPDEDPGDRFHQAIEGRVGRLAGPIHQRLGLDPPESQWDLHLVDQHRDQDAPLPGVIRFVDHPVRRRRVLGPQDNHEPMKLASVIQQGYWA